jgi:outer membrane receptor for ferrienterochelin and colicin
MVTTEVAIKPNLKVVLESETEHLDEVMVVAFGTAKKSQFTGSAGTIKADKITERQVSNVSNALSGQIAGVQTTATNGEPGASATVRIRGIGSMNASNEPLYVIDGVPVNSGDAGQLSDYTCATNNVMNTLNPNDIESITVLKDAAAAAH